MWKLFGIEEVVPLPVLAGIAVCLVVGAIVVHWLLRHRKKQERPTIDLSIDVSQLVDKGPALDEPHLDFYGTPVRVAAIVIAPAGRQGELPQPELLPGALEHLVPGLSDIIAHQRPLIRRWPEQLSSQGFVHSFFNNVSLPGSRGKGSPWCSIAGRLQLGERGILVGLLCIAGSSNGLSQVIVEHEGQWPDILRVRTPST